MKYYVLATGKPSLIYFFPAFADKSTARIIKVLVLHRRYFHFGGDAAEDI